jgi:hypothetical protein
MLIEASTNIHALKPPESRIHLPVGSLTVCQG